MSAGFAGFPKQTSTFLGGLSRNDDKAWLEAHREDCDSSCVEIAKPFVSARNGWLRDNLGKA